MINLHDWIREERKLVRKEWEKFKGFEDYNLCYQKGRLATLRRLSARLRKEVGR